jgi:hypothetical protein
MSPRITPPARGTAAALVSAVFISILPAQGRAADSASVVPGSFTQGTVQASLGAGTTYANPSNSLSDWWTATSSLANPTGNKTAISLSNGNFNSAVNGNATIIAFGNGGGLTLHLDQPIKPIDGQKEFGLFTAQFYNAGTGGLFSGNMQAAILVSADNVNWFTLTGQPITNPTTYTDTSYPLNAPSMGYNFQTLSQAWSYGSPGTSLANLQALTPADFTTPMPDDSLFNGAGANADRLATKSDTTSADYAAIFGTSGGGNWFDISSAGLPEVNYIRLNGINTLNGIRLDAVFANPAAVVPEPASLPLFSTVTFLLTRRQKSRQNRPI